MEPEKKSNGSLVGIVVIIIILVIGGIYIWMSNQKTIEQQNSQSQSGGVTSQDAASVNALQQQSDSTDTNSGVDPNTVN